MTFGQVFHSDCMALDGLNVCQCALSTNIHFRARLVDYLFPMSRPTLFLGPTLKKKLFFFTFRPTLSRGAFFSSENCILNEINKKV